MTFSQRTGIVYQSVDKPLQVEDAPKGFREGAITAAVELIGWDTLRQVSVDSYNADEPVPNAMVDWYQSSESEDRVALMECEWSKFFDIIETVFSVAPRSHGLAFLSAVLNQQLPPKDSRRFEYHRKIQTLFRIHRMGYTFHEGQVVPVDSVPLANMRNDLVATKGTGVHDLTEITDAVNAAMENLLRRPPSLVEAASRARTALEKSRPFLIATKDMTEPKTASRSNAELLIKMAGQLYGSASDFGSHEKEKPIRADVMAIVGAAIMIASYLNTFESPDPVVISN